MSYSKTILAGVIVLTVSASAYAVPTFMGPAAYLQFSDSPFSGLPFSFFHLEDIEDGLFDPPGVSTSPGASVVFPNNPLIDSVDADDGTIDGLGKGHSIFGAGAVGFTFTFDPVALGGFPTHAGIVWTDGAILNEVTFQAWDASNVFLGSIIAPNIGDSSFTGGTAEDRFFGVINSGGISSIRIFNSRMSGGGSGIEVDHLQYGLEQTAATPEPATVLLMGIGLLAAASMRRSSD